MPIFITNDAIIKTKLECIVCPFKASRLHLPDGITLKIFQRAGMMELLYLFETNMIYEYAVPFITDGLKLGKNVIHIIVPDLVASENFKADMYKAYNGIFKLINKNNFQNIVIPPLAYGYKRLGNKNSYLTCSLFLKYFMELYHVDRNFYILTDERTLNDVVTNYVSTYVSTSYPISKRHKPTVFPISNKEDLEKLLKEKRYLRNVSNKMVADPNYNFKFQNTRFLQLYKLIKEQYIDDFSFCYNANISSKEYKNILEVENYVPSKNTLLGICFALKFDVEQTNQILKEFLNEILNEEKKGDQLIIDCLKTQNYDVLSLNEKLYLAGYCQIGSYIKPNQDILDL